LTRIQLKKTFSNFFRLPAKGFMSTKEWNNVENFSRVHTFVYFIENTLIKCLIKQ